MLYDLYEIGDYSTCQELYNMNPFDPDYFTYDTVVGNRTVNGTVYLALLNSTNKCD